MDYVPPQPSAKPGILHHMYPISAFEPTTPNNSDPSLIENTLIWIGGLFDTYGSVKYPFVLARELPPTWSLVTVLLSSSKHGWGTVTLDQDVSELEIAVRYFRALRPKGKIVLMGHSTGCQDAMHYLVSPSSTPEQPRPHVEGAILQAPVSDREGLFQFNKPEVIETADALARKYVAEGRADDVLPFATTKPMFGPVPMSAFRTLSLISLDHKGEDDMFSSDLSLEQNQQTFEKVGKSGAALLLLYSEKDEAVPAFVDKSALIQKWSRIAREGGAFVDEASEKVLPGATHGLNEDPVEVVMELCRRVREFLGKVPAKA